MCDPDHLPISSVCMFQLPQHLFKVLQRVQYLAGTVWESLAHDNNLSFVCLSRLTETFLMWVPLCTYFFQHRGIMTSRCLPRQVIMQDNQSI